jgi:tetratricopeptide (TPR) repeat protein
VIASGLLCVDGSAGSVSGTEGQKAEWLPYYKEAQTLEKAGRLQEAEQQYQVVLDICCDSSEGKETVAVATARRDLGRVLALQKKFDRAEEQYKVTGRFVRTAEVCF